MERGRVGSELRASVALLRAETRLLVGVAVAWAAYGGWVVATGRLLQTVAAGLASSVVLTTVDVSVSAFTLTAVCVWLVLPAAAAVGLVNRYLRNDYDNLTGAYRLDHPSLLVAVPGTVLVGCLALSAALGRSGVLTAVTVLASVHLVVRTVAYGHRVYTLSVPAVLSLLVFVTGLSLGAAWLVEAATGPAWLVSWATQAGVGPVVQTGLRLAAVPAARAVTVALALPGVLATTYLLVQFAVSAVVRMRAPLSNPQRRPDQRFPVMPPVGGPRPETQTDDAESDDKPGGDQQTDLRSDEETNPSDEQPSTHTGTRVFSPDEETEPPPDSAQTDESSTARQSEPTTPVESDDVATQRETDTATESAPPEEASDAADEAWVDDTAVFSSAGRDAAPSYCGACGELLSPGDTACQSCGEPVER